LLKGTSAFVGYDKKAIIEFDYQPFDR